MQHISKLVLFASKLTLFAALICLWSSYSQAQTVAKAEIPFDFICQGQVMPHGTYTISVVRQRFLQLSSSDERFHAVSMIESNDQAASPVTVLVFHRYGERYFLSEFQSEALELEMKLHKSKAEQQAQRNDAKSDSNDTALLPRGLQYLNSGH